MLTAIVTLLAILLLLRAITWAARRFMRWLDEGPQLQRLVDAGLLESDQIESENAAELRAFVEDCKEWRHESRLGNRTRKDRPHLTPAQRRMVSDAQRLARDQYLASMTLSWYHIVSIFLMASVLGLVIEQVYTYVIRGATESRVGLVWGPFSPLYGFGAVFLTLLCWKLREHEASWWAVFVTGAIVGGVLEQVTGWGMQTFLGASSWDYTGYPGAITQWVCLPYLVFWGLLGVAWARVIMPSLLYRIGMPSTLRQVTFVALLALYLSFDIFMTIACFGRMTARDAGMPPANPFEEWIDTHFSDSFIAGRFQNLVIDKGRTNRKAA